MHMSKFFLAAVCAAGFIATAAQAAEPSAALTAVIEARPAEAQARDGARHPAATLTFFSVEPGMTVAEALPGGGWYSNLLRPERFEE